MYATLKRLFWSVVLLTMLIWCLPCQADEMVCSTTEEFVAYLSDVSNAHPQLTSLTFQVPCTNELIQQLKDDDLLHSLEIRAGMVEVHYGGSCRDKIDYRNSKFNDYLPVIATLSDLHEWFDSLPDSLDIVFYFYTLPAARDEITYEAIQDMVYYGCYPISLGPLTTTGMLPTTHCRINYSDGARILHAHRTNTVSQLEPKLQEAYHRAISIVDGLKSSDDVGKARELHDALCRIITYGKEPPALERSSAASALLNGVAVCSGYADAYYLLCNLADIRAVYQVGWIGEKPINFNDLSNGEPHAWNNICLNGKWYMVDVTWDDRSNGQIIYDYFMMSREKAHNTRSWYENEYTLQVVP